MWRCYYQHQAKCISNRASKQYLVQLLNTHCPILILQLTVEHVEHCGPCAELITKDNFPLQPLLNNWVHSIWYHRMRLQQQWEKKDGRQFRSLHTTRQHFSKHWYSEGTGQFLWSLSRLSLEQERCAGQPGNTTLHKLPWCRLHTAHQSKHYKHIKIFLFIQSMRNKNTKQHREHQSRFVFLLLVLRLDIFKMHHWHAQTFSTLD